MNLVHMVPHREYWEGFLFNSLKDYPDGEVLPSSEGGEDFFDTHGTSPKGGQ